MFEKLAHYSTVFDESVLFELRKHCVCHQASSWVASKSVEVETGQETLKLFFENARTHGIAIGDRLTTSYDVGDNTSFFPGPESVSCATKSSLNLVAYHDINMIPDRLHPFLRNLCVTAHTLDSLQNERLDSWIFSEKLWGTLWAVEFNIELALFRVYNSCGSEMTDLVAKPRCSMVTAFEGAYRCIFMCFHGDLEC